MATTRISQLPAVTEATVDDVLIINDGNTTTSRITFGSLQDSIDMSDKADLASPDLTGTPTAPTAAQGTNTTQIATTEYVQTELPLALVTGVGATASPSSAGDTGDAGEIRYDSDYIYICIATDTWKRVSIDTWT